MSGRRERHALLRKGRAVSFLITVRAGLYSHRGLLAAISILALTLFLSLFSFWSFHSFHLDDWNQLAYVAEIEGRDPNFRDPYMGTDESVVSRLAYNLTTWGYHLGSELLGVNHVDFYHSIAPPLLIALSVASVYFLLSALRFPSTVAAAGTLLWVLYFLASSSGGRSPGAFLFDRIAQDKAVAWLCLAPSVLAVLCLADRALGAQRLNTWTRDVRRMGRQIQTSLNVRSRRFFMYFAGLAGLSSLVHPISAVFAGLFFLGICLKSSWERGSWPNPALVAAGTLSLIPAFVVGIFLRTVAPGESPHNFARGGARPEFLGIDITDFGQKSIIEIGPTFIADPAFIAVPNFVALAWIVWSFWHRRGSYPLAVAASLYVVTVIAFTPGLPELMRPVTSTVVVYRVPWIMALGFVLATTDFCAWLASNIPIRERIVGLATGCLAIAAGLTLFAVNYEDLDRTQNRGGPSDAQIETMTRLHELFDGGPEVTVLADRGLSLYIPAYTSDVSVVSQPRIDRVPGLLKEGRYRGDATAALEMDFRYAHILELMAFWDANILVVEPGNPIFRRSVPRPLEACYVGDDAKILALKNAGGCPPGHSSGGP